jgi:hypothetical protein
MTIKLLIACSITAFCFSCSLIDPRSPNVDLKEEMPTVQTTTFTNALSGLGKMSVMYGTKNLNVLFSMVKDDTGTNIHTGGEIPLDISEMVKSSLNAIGGNVHYIPYELGVVSDFSKVYGTKFQLNNKPDIYITGGITQFDRGLATSKKGFNASAEGTWGGRDIGMDADFSEQASTGCITVDFNAIDFVRQIGIPRIQAVNQIKVYKGVKENELGFTVLGPSIGLSGSMKKIQGRHAAVRLLVELSMIQVVGRYLKLPYWKLVPGLPPDQVVLDAVRDNFYAMDHQTQAKAIQRFASATGNSSAAQDVSAENYVKLYCALPLSGGARIVIPSQRSSEPPPLPVKPSVAKVDTDSVPSKAPMSAAAKASSPTEPAQDVMKVQTKVELNSADIVFDAIFKPEQNITLNKTFQADDKIKIYFTSTQDAYFYWFMKGASGAHYLLFPNSGTGANSLVRKNEQISIPPNGNFRFDNQPGIEEINIIFAVAKIQELDQAVEEALANNGRIKNSWISSYEAMDKYQKITLRMKHN